MNVEVKWSRGPGGKFKLQKGVNPTILVITTYDNDDAGLSSHKLYIHKETIDDLIIGLLQIKHDLDDKPAREKRHENT